ncbi:MAG: hypothetical protein MUO24_12805 [Desulfobacterales bacterium]|nr:hypothetical protein [Desulfobacterales bacterium]
MNAFTDMLHNGGFLLGFVSTGIAYAYIGSLLASLLCVFYGLILWNRGKRVRRVWSWHGGGRVKKGRGPRWRRWR